MANVESALAGFEKNFGYPPEGVWSAPGRVNLIGEHTDYNEGFVLPFAINRRTFAAAAARDDFLVRVSSSFAEEVVELPLGEITRQSAAGWAAYPMGVAWAIAQQVSGKGFDLFVDSNVPVGAGLSSSAAIECSVALALNDLWGAGLDLKTLAKIGQQAENEIVGAPTGIMDQTASLFGKADHAVFLDCRSLDANPVELKFADNSLELLIIDTKVAHRLVDGGYAERRAACERGAKTLGVSSLRDLGPQDLSRAEQLLGEVDYRRVRHVITENNRVVETVRLLRETGPLAIGDLLYASHVSMRDDFEISIDELDVAVETAMRNGAIGSRMTGGGFGGAAIALVSLERAGAVTLAIKAEFEELGFAAPEIFTVSADVGAKRES